MPKSKRKYKFPIVKNTEGDVYELQDLLFHGRVYSEGGENPHFAVRQEFYGFFISVMEANTLALPVVPAAPTRKFVTYRRSLKAPAIRDAFFYHNTGELVIGCNRFSKTASQRIARWAGVNPRQRLAIFGG